MDISLAALGLQLFIGIVLVIFVFNLSKSQKTQKVYKNHDSQNELDKLYLMRKRSLSEPLNERSRPNRFDQIIGQDEGIKALRAAICGPNPNHVLIYGPPGVGKTCAARLVLEAAKKCSDSPFMQDARFIEMDATCVRFDERAIADPLIGSVHDPIYQGAGPMGVAGIPQPKPGAVTKAHCGILFLDEIGELHPSQMNKLLKVLEDRKVFFESAYYSSEDTNIPRHIHDIFENGLPADFRLIGATTRTPNEISPALRSRCLEIFFRQLSKEELETVAKGACSRSGYELDPDAQSMVGLYAENGRDAVNIIQLAGGIAYGDGRSKILKEDVEWVVTTCHYHPRLEKKVTYEPQAGLANGLAITNGGQGLIFDIEAIAIPVKNGMGKLTITGMIEEEEMRDDSKSLKRKSTARGSVENVLCVLRKHLKIDVGNYDIHLNLPGAMPVDGPSAGIAIAVAVFSAITGEYPTPNMVLTGELSIRALVRPVGGIKAKVDAALEAGAKIVIIPEENWQDCFNTHKEVVAVRNIQEVMSIAFRNTTSYMPRLQQEHTGETILTAKALD